MTKILVIDNEAAMLQLLKHFLENEGYEVLTAESSQKGLELAREHFPTLVILDLVMPVMDGFETCRRLRELGIQSVLVTSQRHDERNVIRALAPQFASFFLNCAARRVSRSGRP